MSPHDASDNTHSIIPGAGLRIRVWIWKAVTCDTGGGGRHSPDWGLGPGQREEKASLEKKCHECQFY